MGRPYSAHAVFWPFWSLLPLHTKWRHCFSIGLFTVHSFERTLPLSASALYGRSLKARKKGYCDSFETRMNMNDDLFAKKLSFHGIACCQIDEMNKWPPHICPHSKVFIYKKSFQKTHSIFSETGFGVMDLQFPRPFGIWGYTSWRNHSRDFWNLLYYSPAGR